MKLFILTVILSIVFIFNANSQSIKYFRSYIFDERTFELKPIYRVNDSIVDKIDCFAVTYDNLGRISKMCFMKKGQIAEIDYIGISKIIVEYKGNFENRCYFDIKGNPTLNTLMVHKYSIQKNYKKNQLLVKCFDKNGLLAPDINGISTYLYTLDSRKWILKEQFIDTNGLFFDNESYWHVNNKWTENSNSVTKDMTFHYKSDIKQYNKNRLLRIVRILDKRSLLTLKETTYEIKKDSVKTHITIFSAKYDINGNCIEIKKSFLVGKLLNGESVKSFKYDKFGNIMEIDSKFSDFTHSVNIVTNSGYTSSKTEYDFAGNILKYSMYDSENVLTDSEYGFAVQEFIYDNKNRKIEEKKFDKKGLPVVNQIFLVKRKYDDNNNIIEESYWGANNKLMGNKNNVAIIRSEYDMTGEVKNLKYYDINDNLMFE